MINNDHFHFAVAFANEGYSVVHQELRVWKREDDDQVSVIRFDGVLVEYTETVYQRGNIFPAEWQALAVRSLKAVNDCGLSMKGWRIQTKHVLLTNTIA